MAYPCVSKEKVEERNYGANGKDDSCTGATQIDPISLVLCPRLSNEQASNSYLDCYLFLGIRVDVVYPATNCFFPSHSILPTTSSIC